MVADNIVYICTREFVYALDAEVGEILWLFRQERNDDFHSVLAAGGTDVFAGTARGFLYALNATTGKILWVALGDSLPLAAHGVPQVAFAEGVVYASAYPGIVMALDAEGGDLLWRVQLPGQSRSASAAERISGGLSSPHRSSVIPIGHVTRPIVGAGIVYVGSNSDDVFALDAATGQLRWQFQTGG